MEKIKKIFCLMITLCLSIFIFTFSADALQCTYTISNPDDSYIFTNQNSNYRKFMEKVGVSYSQDNDSYQNIDAIIESMMGDVRGSKSAYELLSPNTSYVQSFKFVLKFDDNNSVEIDDGDALLSWEKYNKSLDEFSINNTKRMTTYVIHLPKQGLKPDDPYILNSKCPDAIGVSLASMPSLIDVWDGSSYDSSKYDIGPYNPFALYEENLMDNQFLAYITSVKFFSDDGIVDFDKNIEKYISDVSIEASLRTKQLCINNGVSCSPYYIIALKDDNEINYNRFLNAKMCTYRDLNLVKNVSSIIKETNLSDSNKVKTILSYYEKDNGNDLEKVKKSINNDIETLNTFLNSDVVSCIDNSFDLKNGKGLNEYLKKSPSFVAKYSNEYKSTLEDILKQIDVLHEAIQQDNKKDEIISKSNCDEVGKYSTSAQKECIDEYVKERVNEINCEGLYFKTTQLTDIEKHLKEKLEKECESKSDKRSCFVNQCNNMKKKSIKDLSDIANGASDEQINARKIYEKIFSNYVNYRNDKLKTSVEICKILSSDKGIGGYIKGALNLIRIGGPILIILLTLMDGIKNFVSFKEDANKKFFNNLKIRLICGGLLFLVPTIISLLLGMFLSNVCVDAVK